MFEGADHGIRKQRSVVDSVSYKRENKKRTIVDD